MGDASGGTPGCSHANDLKLLLEETKHKFSSMNPHNKCWPCPFCFNKEKSMLRCIMHVKKEHPNLANSTVNDLLSQNVDLSTDDSTDKNNQNINDLSEFLKLVNNDVTDNVQSSTERENETNSMQFEDMLSGDDDDYFNCPHCKEKKTFPFGQRCQYSYWKKTSR